MTPLLTLQQVAALYQVHRTTIWRWTQRGEFPQPVNPGSTRPRWDPKSINAPHD